MVSGPRSISRFLLTAMAHPGEVFYLPPEDDEPEGKGDRPHVLLNLCPPGAEVATFAYGSTQRTDADRGAEHVLVPPFRGTGLLRPTYVYPSRLVSYTAGELRFSAGRIGKEMPAVRASLARALGLGTGVTHETNVHGANRRGRLVKIARELALDWDTQYALVVTEPGYSRHGYQQTVVPLFDETYEARSLDVVASGARWLGRLGRYRTANFATSMVSTLFAPKDISRFLDLVAPAELLAQVDAALRLHFRL